MQGTKRKRALKSITSLTKSHSTVSKVSLDKENIVNQSIPKESIRKESTIPKEDEELSRIFQSQAIRSIEKDELINGRHCLPGRSHESVSEFDLEWEWFNRGTIYKPIATRIRNVANETRDDVVVTTTAATADSSSSTAVTQNSRPPEHVFSSVGSAFEPNFPL
ncbi:predicted protein [Chaetoceros tenuissimus]|uniref:Uncharacterized protein n=1 Tax=Chaetoceros tenuissimus TaxID=426638 RepID=A0AAD3CGL3_9STRA|nr:predicted protein [Chaetoceros tenuissimus]